MIKSSFSVLMSVYYKEQPEFFDLALKSNIEDQTVTPDEFVLICDGKLTKALESVIAAYSQRYPQIFKVYRLEEKRGLGEALRFGLDKCTNEIVARSDSDDVCVPERFEKQLEFLKENPDIDIVGTYIDEFEEDFTCPARRKQLPVEHSDIVRMSKSRNPLNHMTVMFRKSSVLAVGSYQLVDYVEDYYLWLRAIKNNAKLANIPEYLVHARIGNGMESRRGNKKYIGSWKRLNLYMLENRMINRVDYIKNMISIRVFVYMPKSMRSFLYKKILRRST